MKFGKYIEEKLRQDWSEHYLDYKLLKDLIKEASKELESMGPNYWSPRTTSLTVIRAADRHDTAEERFFKLLESEVEKVGRFTADIVDGLRERLFNLQQRAAAEDKDILLSEAKAIGDEFLQLEKFVNLNYMGFHKILKKHDKNLPQSPCRQFYISHLHNQPWVQGNYSDLLVALSDVYSELRGDQPGPSVVQEESGLQLITTKYWVRMSDVSALKHFILQHLPVYQFSQGDYTGDAELVNSVYLDNSSLEMYHARLDQRPNSSAIRISWFGPQEPSEVYIERQTHKESWQGEEDVEDRLLLPEDKVVDFLEGSLDAEEAKEFWQTKGQGEEEVERAEHLFEDLQTAIDAKQLKPMVRTQYMRASFQIPFDPTVRIQLDSNICMIKENPEDGPSCTIAGRWYRDPALPVQRTEITRFPHAVLEIRLALGSEQTTPRWVQELIDSGLLTEIDKFSKHIHGTATLFPDMVQAVPYWVDDESVRASMLLSAPDQPAEIIPTARDQPASSRKPRKGQSVGFDSLTQPLLGGFEEMGTNAQPTTLQPRRKKRQGFLDWWFAKPEMMRRPRIPGVQEGSEPKTYFANERTFLSWLHMAVTMGSISTAMLGVSGGKDDTELIAIILLPVSLLMCGYALLVYYWRTQAITEKTGDFFDDRRGPLALTVVVVAALAAIFIISAADLIESIHNRKPPPGWIFQLLPFSF